MKIKNFWEEIMKFENLNRKSMISILSCLDSMYLGMLSNYLRDEIFLLKDAHNKAVFHIKKINKNIEKINKEASFFKKCDYHIFGELKNFTEIEYKNEKTGYHVLITKDSITFLNQMNKKQLNYVKSIIEFESEKGDI